MGELKAAGRTGTIVSVILGVIGVAMCADALIGVTQSPLQTHQLLAYLEFAVGIGLVVNRAGHALVPRKADGSRSRALAWLVRVVTFIVAVMSIGYLGDLHRGLSMKAVQAELGPAVALIAKSGPKVDESALASALSSAQTLRRATARVSTGASVIWTDGGSIDIDGSTMFVILPQRDWGQFHNDEPSDPGSTRERYDKVIASQKDGGELKCRRAEGSWRCERETISAEK